MPSDRSSDLPFHRFTVLGAGSWGSALANAAARAGRRVTLWTRDAQTAAAMARTRESRRLPGVQLDRSIAVTASLADALAAADAILLVVPAQAVRAVATEIADGIADGTPVIVCAKGIERGTYKFMTQIVSECAPRAMPAILSGPSFADDVARGLPTAVTLAALDAGQASALSQALATATFRPYHSTDVRGTEIGGATKNVLAIAAGIVSGRALGASAAAALITRGFAELVRFGRFFGARLETLTGLSGLGDLVLSCSSPQSRNFSLGLALGSGASLDQARAGGKLAEGAFTASVIAALARENDIDMPIASAVDAVLDGRTSIDAAIEGLLTRPIGAET
ncbi:MAG: NAD(P)-dependent glycerol-3-phosphate dehydrogenase [Pseudorhodoplanes sp.]|nr:NAD(P)-dependent glycerol-3-phosphate dehydrogenase [Pseudorhodoplanes sp.]